MSRFHALQTQLAEQGFPLISVEACEAIESDEVKLTDTAWKQYNEFCKGMSELLSGAKHLRSIDKTQIYVVMEDVNGEVEVLENTPENQVLADDEAEAWCLVTAKTPDEAKSKFPESFAKWQRENGLGR